MGSFLKRGGNVWKGFDVSELSCDNERRSSS